MGNTFQLFSDWLARKKVAGKSLGDHAPVPSVHPPTILVIDDEEGFLETVTIWLRHEGYHVMAAHSGIKGLNMMQYADGGVQVVLLDFRMPQLNGEETLRHLRRLSPHTKVIAVTGVPPEEVSQEFREHTDFFIRKPFAAADLLLTIRAALANTKPARHKPTEARPST